MERRWAGKPLRSRIIAIAASLVLLASTLVLSPGPVARGQQAPLEDAYPDPVPYLTVHGPNDGEPLNNSQDLLISASDQSWNWSYVLVCYGSHMLSSVPVNPQLYGGSQYIAAPVDLTAFQNGPCILTVLLLNDRMETVAATNWMGQVQNPLLNVVGPRMGSRLLFRIRGTPGDVEYRLMAGADPYQLRRSPFDGGAGYGVETVVFGEFPQTAVVSSSGDVSSDESVDIVLNVDNLIRAHTLDGSLVLWTRGKDAKVAYSKPLSLESLPAPQSPTAYTPTSDPPPPTYNR